MEILRPDKKLIEGFLPLSTSTISDALDRFGLRAGCEGIFPIVPGVKMAGPAFTLRYVPVGQVKGTVGDYIDIAQPGDVIVLDNNGRTDCTVWGDILTVVAQRKGIHGTVIDGVCRDVPNILKEKYPIFTRGRFMMTGKDRVMVEAMNVTVSIGKTQVKPGDIMIGDDSGVVVVPRERAEEVLKLALEIETAENQIEEAVRSGLSLKEAREKYHYHSLQSKK
ncbi:MAG: RraA family protein [Deltaproteobacteria bacterium]|nr:RraA family protein [Deltaproteobacteria bacterium]